MMVQEELEDGLVLSQGHSRREMIFREGDSPSFYSPNLDPNSYIKKPNSTWQVLCERGLLKPYYMASMLMDQEISQLGTSPPQPAVDCISA